ncbi:MAG: FHA domain-containing protein [Candidatus Methanomethylicaceae archaeon]
MQRIIIHVIYQEDKTGIDLEVPANIPLEKLAMFLSQALNWNTNLETKITYQIIKAKDNLSLNPQASLSELKLWDGTYLIFKPIISSSSSLQKYNACFVSENKHIYYLVHDFYILGRSSSKNEKYNENLIDLQFEMEGKTVSRRHAKVYHENDNWIFCCLPEAQNETIYNGKKLQPFDKCILQDGDILQLGAVKLKFQKIFRNL